MQADVFRDPRKFGRAARPVIGHDPVACNVLATQAQREIDSRTRHSDYLYLLIRDGDRPVGVVMHTPPFNLFVGPVDPADAAPAATVLTQKLAGRAVPGVTGDSVFAAAVARSWTAAHGGEWVVRMDETLYALDAVPTAPDVAGSAREAGAEDRPWLTRWLSDFHAEANPYEPQPDRTTRATRGLSDRTMLLWVTGTEELPVSLAGVTLPQFGVSRIGPVFTPPAFRGRGYAGALTAAATARAFGTGAARVALYADKANPTSNGVYRRLGYRPVGDAVLISFDS